jgi:nicotinate-nucleotide adenylyltransferase
MVPAPEGAEPLRLGIFGGTFDPPHTGHVAVARDVADALDLHRVLWVPTRVPPHKVGPTTRPDTRLEMTRRAAAADPRFVISDLELRREGPSYTVDTVRTLVAEHPGAHLFLLVGADQVETLDSGWKDPSEILRLATLVIMDREGRDARALAPPMPGMEDAIHVPVTRIDVSSTQIRALVAGGSDVAELVPPGVVGIIQREGLYRPGTEVH